MSTQTIINSMRAMAMRGKKFSPKDITKYEEAIRKHYDDTRVETMMLYVAEVLHDEYGFGMKRIGHTLTKMDEHMKEWLQDDFSMDQLRLRVFKKTKFLFACDIEDQKRIQQLFEQAGYEVKTEEKLK